MNKLMNKHENLRRVILAEFEHKLGVVRATAAAAALVLEQRRDRQLARIARAAAAAARKG